MRIQLPGVRRGTADITFEFEGERITAAAGETVAAALLNAGHRELRESHVFPAKRAGIFCGMGVCGECIVLVDGVRRRACLEPAKAGIKVLRHPARAPIASETPPRAERRFAADADDTPSPGAPARGVFPLPEVTLTPDVLIVGAGPAGLSAARVTASAGLNVIVADERRAPGGQYFKQPNAGFEIDAGGLDAQFRAGRALIEAAHHSGARMISQATVWGAFAPWQVGAPTTLGEIRATTPTQRLKIQPRRLVIATGAYERALPFPGWDSPGVMTTGAAQTLLRANQLAPGARVLIAGNGPLNFQVARELTTAGVEVVALVEAGQGLRLGALAALVRMTASSPSLVTAGMRDVLLLRRRGVKIRYRHVISRVTPGLSATICRIDENGCRVPESERQHSVDAVCTGYGFLAQSEIARALGCAHAYDLRHGGAIVQRDADCRTSAAGVFVAGDAGGLGGAHIAMSQGVLAGVAIARDLGKTPDASAVRDADVARRMLSRHGQFQAALWSLFEAPLLLDQLAEEDTPICRCEGVTKRTLKALMERSGRSLGAIKRECRAGMGGCQGRYCATVMAEMLAHTRHHASAARRTSFGTPPTEADLFAPRPPFRPVPIGLIAASAPQPESELSDAE